MFCSLDGLPQCPTFYTVPLSVLMITMASHVSLSDSFPPPPVSSCSSYPLLMIFLGRRWNSRSCEIIKMASVRATLASRLSHRALHSFFPWHSQVITDIVLRVIQSIWHLSERLLPPSRFPSLHRLSPCTLHSLSSWHS